MRTAVTSRAVAVAVLAGLLVLLAMLLVPITGHHGDGEQACGSVLRHARVGGMLPRVDGAAQVNIADSTDACPPEDFQHQQSVALWTASAAAGLTMAFGVLVLRRHRDGSLAAGDTTPRPTRP
jgi:hypothetical protein